MLLESVDVEARLATDTFLELFPVEEGEVLWGNDERHSTGDGLDLHLEFLETVLLNKRTVLVAIGPCHCNLGAVGDELDLTTVSGSVGESFEDEILKVLSVDVLVGEVPHGSEELGTVAVDGLEVREVRTTVDQGLPDDRGQLDVESVACSDGHSDQHSQELKVGRFSQRASTRVGYKGVSVVAHLSFGIGTQDQKLKVLQRDSLWDV